MVSMLGLLVGAAAGLAVAIGGAVKDGPHEGFKPLTFARSPVIGMVVGAFMPPLGIPAVFLATIGVERATVESYKLLRAKVPGKFTYGEWGVPLIRKQEAYGLF